MGAWSGYKRRRERREREYVLEALFANDETGFVYLFDDLRYLFQDSAGSSPVTATTDPVGRVNSRSPNAVPATQGTAANRPTWVDDAEAPYLLGDGSNDVLTSTFVPPAAVTLAVACRQGSATNDIFIGGGTSTGNHRAFLGMAANGKAALGWGSESVVAYGDALVGDHTLVLTGDSVSRDLWCDGRLLNSSAPSGGPDGTGGGVSLFDYNNAGNFGVVPALGRLYAALAIGRRLKEAEIRRVTRLFEELYS